MRPTHRLTLASALAVMTVTVGAFGQTQLTPDAINPLIRTGAPGTWDSQIVKWPCAVQQGATTHVFYTGGDIAANGVRIGLASSTDGVTFTKDPANPILSKSASGWDSATVDSPVVIQDSSGDWIMLYAGSDQPPGGNKWNIGRAVSTNGPAGPYTKDPSPVLSIGAPGDWDSAIIHPDTLIEVEPGNYWLFYTAGTNASWSQTNPLQVGVAFSTDTINWTKYDDPRTTGGLYANSDPVLFAGSDGEWDTAVAGTAGVYTDGSRWHLYYTGGTSMTSAGDVGYATSVDGLHWVKSPANPILSKGDQFWSADWIEGPSVLPTNSGYSVYYEGGSQSLAPAGAIGLATGPVTEDLFLDATPEDPVAGETLTFQTFEGNAGIPTLLFVVEVNGAPFSWYLPPATPFDANGIATRVQVTPPGLAGTTVSFQSFSLGKLSGNVVLSNREDVSFQ